MTLETRIDRLDSLVTCLSADLNTVRELIAASFKKIDANFESITKEIAILHAKIDAVDRKVDLLKGDTNEGFQDVGMKLENITEEISKIGTVTKYDGYFKNMQIFKN